MKAAGGTGRRLRSSAAARTKARLRRALRELSHERGDVKALVVSELLFVGAVPALLLMPRKT
jgi:hypothetical protein